MAGLDTSIAMGVKQPQFESPLNALANVLQVQSAQQNNKLGMMKMEEYTRGLEENNKLNQLYSGALKPDGTIDRQVLFRNAATGGLGSKIPGLQKTFTESDTAAATLDKTRFEVAAKRYDTSQKTFGALAQRPDLSKDLVLAEAQSMVDMGIISPEIFAKLPATLPDNPDQLRANLRQRLSTQLTPEQILTIYAPKPTEVNNGQQKFFRDTNPNSPTYGKETAGAKVQLQASPEAVLTDNRTRSEGVLNRDVTTRGQDLTDYRARETAAANAAKDKALTEGQSKALLFGTRMQEADKVLGAMTAKGVIRPGVIKGAAEAVGNIVGLGTDSMGGALSDAAGSLTNWTQSAEQQQVEQVQRDFINAVLRRESGASISAGEFRNANKQYFPQPNDDEATLALKAKNRALATQGMLAEVPDSKARVSKVVEASAPTVQPGKVEGGYRFKGGDPSIPSNWEKL